MVGSLLGVFNQMPSLFLIVTFYRTKVFQNTNSYVSSWFLSDVLQLKLWLPFVNVSV